MYVGQFENSKRHGRGTYTFANGSVEVGFYEEGRPKGPGVRLEKASGHFWLLKDGQQVRKIDPTEAWSSFFWVVSNLCWRQAKSCSKSVKRRHGAPFWVVLNFFSCWRQAQEVVKEHGLPELPW